MSGTKPTVTLTLELVALRQLFAGGNHSGGGTVEDADPLALALDIIEHASAEFFTLHDALLGQEERVEDLALHAWRISEQLTSGIALVQALKETSATSEAAEAEEKRRSTLISMHEVASRRAKGAAS